MARNYKKETGKPIPQPFLNPVKCYGFDRLEPGDSFLVPEPDRWNSVRVAASAYAKRHGQKWVTRKVDGGVRVWRVE